MKKLSITGRVATLSFVGNLILGCIKIMIGIMSKSQAMMSDAINSITDVFSSLVAMIGGKISQRTIKEKDKNKKEKLKTEYIFSQIIAISMIIASLKMMYNSTVATIYKNDVVFSFGLIMTCIITIVVKLILYIFSRNELKKEYNILTDALKKDHRNDILIATLTLFSTLLSKYEINFIDGVVGIIISIWILYTGVKLFCESLKNMLNINYNNTRKHNN